MAGNERNEQSVLISLDSLGVDTPSQGAGAGADGDSGLIDLGGLGAAPGEESPALVAPAFEAAAPTYVKPKSGVNPLVVVGAAVAVIGLLGGGIYFGMQMGGEGEASPGAAPASVASAAPSAVTSAPASTAPSSAAAGSTAASAVASAPGSAAASAPESAAGSQPAQPEKAPATKAKRKYTAAEIAAYKKRMAAKKAAEAKAKAEAAAKAAAAPAKPKAPAAPAKPAQKDEVDDMLGALSGKKPAAARTGGGTVVAPDDPLLPKKLSKGQILGVVRKNAGAVARCKAETKSQGGTVFVDLSIAKTGSVKTAKVVSAQKGTPLASCVERKVKVFRFPQFNGPPMRIKLPFAM